MNANAFDDDSPHNTYVCPTVTYILGKANMNYFHFLRIRSFDWICCEADIGGCRINTYVMPKQIRIDPYNSCFGRFSNDIRVHEWRVETVCFLLIVVIILCNDLFKLKSLRRFPNGSSKRCLFRILI